MLKTIFTSPKLEYWRVWIPQPIFNGLVVFIGTTLFIFIFHLLANPAVPVSRGADIWSFPLTIPIVGSIGYTIVLCIFRVMAWLSGYRPFKISKAFQNEHDINHFEECLKKRIQEYGFELFWEHPQKGFIGVKGIELVKEGGVAFNEKAFPIRLIYFKKPSSNGANQFTATIKAEIRSIPVWDTGEGEVLQQLGHELLREL